jgi:phosphoribosyl-ATP pyrophosphohydrolase/phosphoribosyl-AMP cyclohydrolase
MSLQKSSPLTEKLSSLDWKKGDNLLPAVIQDHQTLQVLMVGMMSEESLRITLDQGWITFYSRTRQSLWTKGEASGNKLKMIQWEVDCDQDCLLFQVEPIGPTCHRNTYHCFGDGSVSRLSPMVLRALEARILKRKAESSSLGAESYTQKLLKAGPKRCGQKVGEEGVEVALAAAAGNLPELISEAADLLYHLTVTLVSRGVSLDEVCQELMVRMER